MTFRFGSMALAMSSKALQCMVVKFACGGGSSACDEKYSSTSRSAGAVLTFANGG